MPPRRRRLTWLLAGTALVFATGAGLQVLRHRTPAPAPAETVARQASAPQAAVPAAQAAVIEAEVSPPPKPRSASAAVATANAAPVKNPRHAKAAAASSSNGPARQTQAVAQAQARAPSVETRLPVDAPVQSPSQVEERNLSGGAPVETRTPTPVPGSNDPMSPRKACGARVFLALKLCMEQECETPRFRNHPQCLRLREWEARGHDQPPVNEEH